MYIMLFGILSDIADDHKLYTNICLKLHISFNKCEK